MKLARSNPRLQAFTMFEALVVILALFLLAAWLLPYLARHRPNGAQRTFCVSNLKQISLALRIWEGDNNNQYPMAVSVTNGGAMELVATGNVAACFRVISNELSTTKILICPADPYHTRASNFDVLDNSNISYFLGVDVTNEKNRQMLLDGDDNFTLNGSPVKSGIFSASTNTPITWGPGRHGDTDFPRHFWQPRPRGFVGNLGAADGSVYGESSAGLQRALFDSARATNRLAIP
jgi:competence protein ComGC